MRRPYPRTLTWIGVEDFWGGSGDSGGLVADDAGSSVTERVVTSAVSVASRCVAGAAAEEGLLLTSLFDDDFARLLMSDASSGTFLAAMLSGRAAVRGLDGALSLGPVWSCRLPVPAAGSRRGCWSLAGVLLSPLGEAASRLDEAGSLPGAAVSLLDEDGSGVGRLASRSLAGEPWGVSDQASAMREG